MTSRDSLLLRASISFVWLFTGLAVLHPYYRETGLGYLLPLGLPGWLMYATCAFEVALGIWILVDRASTATTVLQIAMIATFTLILSVRYPELLAHPFGVLSKNVSLIAILITVWHLEREGWSSRAAWSLRFGMAFVWFWDGLVPCFLVQHPMLRQMISALGLGFGSPQVVLSILGIGQALSAIAVLAARGAVLRWLLLAHVFGVIGILLITTWYQPLLWAHPFGPFTKNVPLLIGTGILFVRSPKLPH